MPLPPQVTAGAVRRRRGHRGLRAARTLVGEWATSGRDFGNCPDAYVREQMHRFTEDIAPAQQRLSSRAPDLAATA
jgi:hypothetical protein